MNILPKKKWHVRTKENMARVRRDEAKAAAEEKKLAERIALAENEDRVRRLKARAASEYGASPFDIQPSNGSGDVASTSEKGGHVNFFVELEEEERHNLSQGNKEYEKEKREEQHNWESKMGIMKRFAEDTKEYSKEKNWWECIPLVRKDITDGFIPSIPNSVRDAAQKSGLKVTPIIKQRISEHVAQSFPEAKILKAKKLEKKSSVNDAEKKKLKILERKLYKQLKKAKRKRKKEKKRKKQAKKKELERGRKESSSSSSSSTSSSSVEIVKNTKLKDKDSKKADEKLQKLREERLFRERQEKARVEKLFNVEKEEPTVTEASSLNDERKRKYNTQFNPDFAKR